MIIKGMPANHKKGEWPKICKLGSHDHTSEWLKITQFLWKIHEYESTFRDLSGEIVKFQLLLKMKLLISDWLKFMQIRSHDQFEKKSYLNKAHD